MPEQTSSFLKDILLILSFALSVIALTWNIFTYLYERRRKLKVVLEFQHKHLLNVDGTVNSFKYAKVRVINIGRKNIYIEKPLLEANKYEFNGVDINKLQDDGELLSYPAKLESGQSIYYNFDLGRINQNLKESIENNDGLFFGIESMETLRGIVNDSFGTKYCSNLKKSKEIYKFLEDK